MHQLYLNNSLKSQRKMMISQCVFAWSTHVCHLIYTTGALYEVRIKDPVTNPTVQPLIVKQKDTLFEYTTLL